MVILQKFDFTDFLWVDKKQSSTEPKFTWLSTNAYEEEGIAYCFGYGAGEVAQFVVGSKLASKLKGGKVKSSAFGYMDADDALRYNQYWDDVAKGLYNNPYGGKLSLDEISRMQCGFDKIAQKNWEYELGLDRYNNRILDYHNENEINNAIKGGSKTLKVDELVTRDSKFLDAEGKIDWEKWAPNGGRVPGTIKEGQTLPAGTIIDRYGNKYGKYTSPAGVPYEQRALPYIENPNAYHKYKVVKPIDNVTISEIAAAFEQPGGGIQYELPSNIKQLLKDGYIKEID